MASVSASKPVNLGQLSVELGRVALHDISHDNDHTISTEAVSQPTLETGVDDHVADALWVDPSPPVTTEKSWHAKLAAEIAFLADQVATWPASPTVAFRDAAIKRLVRNQLRVLNYIHDATLDSGNG